MSRQDGSGPLVVLDAKNQLIGAQPQEQLRLRVASLI
jgi:hypothetical protein